MRGGESFAARMSRIRLIVLVAVDDEHVLVAVVRGDTVVDHVCGRERGLVLHALTSRRLVIGQQLDVDLLLVAVLATR